MGANPIYDEGEHKKDKAALEIAELARLCNGHRVSCHRSVVLFSRFHSRSGRRRDATNGLDGRFRALGGSHAI